MGESRRMARAHRRIKNTKRGNLCDLIQREKERHVKMGVEFNWPELCKHVPKCVLYRACHLRQIAVKVLGQCSYKLVDRFLMFTFELLVTESALTSERFATLKEAASSLTLGDAETMFKLIVIIRQKFSETHATRSVDSSTLTGDVKLIDNLFGLKFEYKSARESLKDTAHGVDETRNSSLKREKKGTKPLAIAPKFNEAKYEEMLNDYYEKHLPIISRESFKNTVIDTLRGKNPESDLIDFLGFDAMEFMQYIIENRECIALLNTDFTSLRKRSDVAIEKPAAAQSQTRNQLWRNMKKVGKKLSKLPGDRQKKKKNILKITISNL